MAFSDTKQPGDLITASDYNDLVDDLFTRIKGNNINKATADTSANLPVPGEGDKILIETDTGRTLYDNGSEFVEVGLSETQINLSNLGSRSHSELTNITSDDHHTKTTDLDDLNDVTGVTAFEENSSGNLPNPGTEGRIFFETDIGRTLYDNGSTFVEIGLSESEIKLGNVGNLDAGQRKITNLADPTDARDAVNKQFVDRSQAGLEVKESTRVATAGISIDLTNTSNPNPIDEVNLDDGDRVLLKDQNDATENGIYNTVNATDPTTWVRSNDFDEDSKVAAGAFVFVEEGGDNKNKGYVVKTNDPITLGSTAIEWTQFSGLGQVVAGDGIEKSGDTLNVRMPLKDDATQVTTVSAIDFGGDDFLVTDDTDNTATVQLSNDSLSIAGNSVNLGGSTTVDYVDLNDTGASFPIPNTDLSNSSVSVAGNSVDLGGSTAVNHSDLSNIGTGDHHTRYSDEEAQDAINSLLTAGNNLSKTYDDSNNELTLDASLLGDTNQKMFVGKMRITSTGTKTISSIPFEPNRVVFHAELPVSDFDTGEDGGVSDSTSDFAGSMHGFARNDGGTTVQQAVASGAAGNSINNIRHSSSSTDCIFAEYGNQNGNLIGSIEANLASFNSDGFDLNVSTLNLDDPGIVVQFIAFRSEELSTEATDVSDDGSLIETNVGGINFGSDLTASNDGDNTVTASLTNNSLTVAGNTVALGGSTAVEYIDLNDTGSSFPIPNSDLSNSSIDVAGNSVSLGGSASVASTDLSDSGSIDASTVKGNDIDSDGDGVVDKADDSQTLQGNQPSDLGNTIDNKSITKNDDGDIQVKKPSDRVAATFTNSKEGFSAENHTDGFLGIANSQLEAISGKGSVSDKQDAKKSFNNIQTEKIEIPYQFDIAGSEGTTDNGVCKIFVNGNQVIKEENSGNISITKSGTVTVTNQNLQSVRILAEAGSVDFNGPFTQSSTVKIDEVRVGSTGNNKILIGDAGT